MVNCVAVGCSNRSERGFGMHVFPWNEARRKIWMSKVKRKDFNPTKSSCLCEMHFEKDQYFVNKRGKRRLKPTAVPTIFPHIRPLKPRKQPFDRNKVQRERDEHVQIVLREHDYVKTEPSGIMSPHTTNVENDSEPEDCCEMEVIDDPNFLMNDMQEKTDVEVKSIHHEHHMAMLQLREMEQVCQNQAKSIQLLQSDLELSKSNKEENKSTDRLNKSLSKLFRPPDQLLALQRESMNGCKWHDGTIKQGLQLKFACGTSGYETLLKQGFPLPSIRTLRERTEHIEFESGVLDEVFDILKLKAQVLNQHERLCCLTMDEFAISTSIDYDSKSDKFVGGVTLPGHSGVATKCLVFQVNGLTTRFKQIVAYYFTGNVVKGETLGPIVTDIVKRLAEISFECLLVTCDMGSSNVACWN